MRSILAVTALLSISLLVPAGASAAAGHQSTSAQTDLRQGVKQERQTYKRHQIIRAEKDQNKPNVAR